jgi:O-antigen/teichoic acid export membrane protein
MASPLARCGRGMFLNMLRPLLPMYLLAALRFVTPVLVLPVMASRLGAEAFGHLSLGLVWAGMLSLWVEGGFLAAATRYAVSPDDERRRRLAQQVFSARLVSSLFVFVVGCAIGMGHVFAEPTHSLWDRAGNAVVLAVLSCALGWPSIWYWQATSQLHRWAVVELGIQAMLVLSYLLWAHSVAAFVALQALAAITSALVGWLWLRRQLFVGVERCRLWSARAVLPGMALGWQMLPMSLVGMAYTLGLPAVAATQISGRELGVYFLADRVVRALMAVTDPITQLIYPRIVERLARGARDALRYTLRWCLFGLALGILISVIAALAWSFFSEALRGIDRERLGQVLAVLIGLVPLSTGWRFIGHWMLATGKYDHALRWCIVVGAVVGVAGALAAGQDAVHLAGVAVLAEVSVMLAAVTGVVITRRRQRGVKPVGAR